MPANNTKKKSTTYVVPYRLFRCIPRERYIAMRGDVSFKKNEAEQLPQSIPRAANRYGNLLRGGICNKRSSNIYDNG